MNNAYKYLYFALTNIYIHIYIYKKKNFCTRFRAQLNYTVI